MNNPNLCIRFSDCWVRVLENSTDVKAEISYMLYDKKARPVKTYSTNHLGGFISTEIKLDFTGKTLYAITQHKKDASSTIIQVREDFTYSPQDRLLTHTHKVNGNPTELLAKNDYDNLGQLKRKSVGATDISGTASLQKVDYNYNIRGWLNNINDVNELTLSGEPTDLFAFRINYNLPENTLGGQIESLYNGNIAETLWKTDSDNVPRSYGYQYDELNRLLKATYQKNSSETRSYDEKLHYDKNGNIKRLERNGFIDSDSQGMSYPIDDLIYTYANGNNSNQLLAVLDNSNSIDGFKDGNLNGTDYRYDDYGNMTEDKNKKIDKIFYNHLNLPVKIEFSTAGHNQITYLYNAVGVKLGKIVSEESGSIEHKTHYLSGFQYLDEELQFFPTAEGYVSVTNGDKFNYVYNYTDHLGNIRLSYTKDPSDGQLKILEENHYYPFGLKHSNYNNDRVEFDKDENGGIFAVLRPVDRSKYQYKYNGKEFQDELNLNWYDYGARNYDAVLGCWINIDPLAEKFPNVSPYAYALNNPIVLTDPDGREPIPFYRRWFGASRQAWQWYSTGASDRMSSWDSTTFNSAASYSTQHQRASAYETVYQRNAYYGWVQGQADAKGYSSKWFGAAALVTQGNAVGGVDLMNMGFMHDNTESFLRGGNKFLFSHNMKNAKDFLADGKLSGGFTDANGNKQSFEGLTGQGLDNKMVEFEQSKVQGYINSYKGNDLGEIMKEINGLMSNPLAPGDVSKVMKDSFNGGKSFNFKNYSDRVKLGQELIKKAYDE